MNAVEKALWFIESHFAGEMTLEDVAEAVGVSRFHLTRAFGAATGYSIMRYVRGRRLTEAAKALSQGAPDILSVALDAGYGSHEAFTHAFRDEFGVTPEMIRAQRYLKKIEVVEPIRMDETLLIKLEPPRLESGRRLLIAGIGARYTCEASAGVPSQWQRFLPYLDNVPGQIGRTTWSRVRIPEQKYAVFSQQDHISTIRSTWNTIWNEWLPNSEYEVADAADFEWYGEDFNPATGMGGFELWVPIKALNKQ